MKNIIEINKSFLDCNIKENSNIYKDIQGLLDLYNKEKETSHFLQSQLDIQDAQLIQEKEKNKELLEGLKYRVKYCGLLERELYGNENIELTKIEQELLEERN